MKAALSLDLDNQWSYMKTHGDAGWQSFPSYVDLVVPRALDLLEKRRLRITFFIVGQDAALARNAAALGEIAKRGHEIGNHSFHHEPWLHRRSDAEIDDEMARAEASIEMATGVLPRGFRGPGFVRSDSMLNVLARRGYAYDASSLPTFIGPFARAYYFRTARLDSAARREREDLFGKFLDGFQPNRRHVIATQDGVLEEIPVTTMPVMRTPVHISYILYLATISRALALSYFRFAMDLCKLSRVEPSILLHPLDFIDGRECRSLTFFPAMQMASHEKLSIVDEALCILEARFDVVPLLELSSVLNPVCA